MRKKKLASIALVVLVSVLGWFLGIPVLVTNVNAADLVTLSDTLSDSRPSVASNHTVKFVLASAVTASDTIVVAFDNTFTTTGFANTDPLDFDIATSTEINGSYTDLAVAADGACVAGGFEIDSISDSDFTFTYCAASADIDAGTAIEIEIGTNATSGGAGNTQMTNPASAVSYVVTATAPASDSSDTRIAIVAAVTVSASVATSLTFTVAGVASGETINADGTTTSTGATATALPFGVLTPDTPKVLAQTLTVSTNAKNGFAVTVQQNGNLVSANGADIDTFKDDADTATPEAWAAPAETLDSENTYGHYGVTSEDADLNTNEFGDALYAGNIDTARTIFSHTGPADGTTANKGLTRVGYKIQVSNLQEAADDYTNRLTYVATPVF